MDFNGYAVRLPEGIVLIDPAYADDSTWSAIQAVGKPISILLTNKDHERASAELRHRFKIPVYIHEAEASLLSVQPEMTFADGARLNGVWDVVRFRRMKSPAECAFFGKERRLLVVGDALAGHPAGKLGLVKKHLDQPGVLEELKTLLELDFDAILMGDGQPMLSGAQKALRDLCQLPHRTAST